MEKYINSTKYAKEEQRSYTRLFPSLTSLSETDFTPEVKYYTYKAALDDAIQPSTIDFSTIL